MSYYEPEIYIANECVDEATVEWLENRVDECLRQAGASFEDYNDVMRFVEKLKGGRNG